MIAAIYARKSTDQAGVADEQKSVARQVEHARAYATLKGWTVDEASSIFVDDGISGAEFANRPGFLRLMNTLKPRPPFQILIMSEESRLGREAIETAYALKQLVTAGVRVFFYLEDRERTLDSPTDKIMLSLTTFADELEREKARQRTRDAMLRKAQAGHVTGGACFGYRNVEILDAAGRRSHVERTIEPAEAAVIRRIFELSAEGYGMKGIAKTLNAEGAPAPRAQQGRSRSWAPTTVREVLFRPLYRGEIIWAQTAKRDKWGRKHQAAKPETEWIRRPAPELQIVDETLWQAAHARLDAARAVYLKVNSGQCFGRPALASPSKYLLTNLVRCGQCGGTLHVVSRSHGASRKRFYGCSSFHERGTCDNRADVPIDEGDAIVVEALLDDIIDPTIVRDAVDEALRLLESDHENIGARLDRLEGELATVERERARLVSAIASGGMLPGLLDGLREREARRTSLEADRDAVRVQARQGAHDTRRVREELLELAGSWRQVLADDPTNARPIVSSLLKNRVMFTPTGPARWRVNGEGHLIGLFSREWTGRIGVPNGIRRYLETGLRGRNSRGVRVPDLPD